MLKVFSTCKADIVKAEEDENNLLKNMAEFNDKSRPKTKEGKDKKRDTYENSYSLYEGRELTLNAFKSGIFPIKQYKVKSSKYYFLKKCFKDYQ